MASDAASEATVAYQRVTCVILAISWRIIALDLSTRGQYIVHFVRVSLDWTDVGQHVRLTTNTKQR